MEKGKWNMPLVTGVWVAYWILFIIYLGNTRTPDYLTGQKTEGEVIDVYEYVVRSRKGWAKKSCPVVRYYVNSVEYRYDDAKQSYLGLYSKGDKVTMIYNPHIPGEACILGLIGYWINITEIVTAFFIILIITVFITVVPYGYDDKVTAALKK
jgi:hypothetical protein